MTAPLHRALPWRIGDVVDSRIETATATTLVVDVDRWPGHLAGQHVDVRLTAEDGYSAQRSYSLASAANGTRVELTVQTVLDGEVSPYLTDHVGVGDQLELRGPIGGWFVWDPDSTSPVLLVGGGSGIVPLRSMLQARASKHSRVPFRALYSVRTPGEVLYAAEFRSPRAGVDVTVLYTREAPAEVTRAPARITAAEVASLGWPADFEPDCFVCGPAGFVDAVADMLIAQGHSARRIRTERFGPTR